MEGTQSGSCPLLVSEGYKADDKRHTTSVSAPTIDEHAVIMAPKSLSPRDYKNLVQWQGSHNIPDDECEEDGRTGGTSSKDGEEALLKEEEEEDNRRREQEMWAMLAGQAAFKLESFIFHKVLPESFIKPHIFPRHVKDMQSLIENYTARGEADRLEEALSKWDDLKSQWRWKREHEAVLATVKYAYLHISKPLEVMMKLDREHGDSVENAKRAFRMSLHPQLHKAGGEVVEMMLAAELLTAENDGNHSVTKKTLSASRRLPRSAPVIAVSGTKRLPAPEADK